MEIYNPTSKEIESFTEESNVSSLISAKEGSHDYPFLFCLKIVLRYQWPRVLMSSFGFLFVIVLFDFIFYYNQTDSNQILKYLLIFDSCLIAFDIIVSFFIFAYRMKLTVKNMPTTFVEVYEDFIQMKEGSQTGKVVFKLPFNSFIKAQILKEGYVLIFKGPNNMNASIILQRNSIEEKAIADFERILKGINSRINNN